MQPMMPVIIISWVATLILLLVGVSRTVAVRRVRQRAEQLTRGDVEEAMAAAAESAAIPLTMEELQKSFLDRVLRPMARRFGEKMLKRGSIVEQWEELLEMAGRPYRMTVVELFGFRIVGAMVGGGLLVLASLFLLPRFPGKQMQILMLLSALPLVGFMYPLRWLRKKAKERHAIMNRQMPDMVDLVTLSLEAGLGLDNALAEAVQRFKGPLAVEFSRVLGEVMRGKARSQALRDMAERVKLEDLSLMVSAVHQSETLGSSLVQSLRALAVQVRKKRMRIVRERAAKLPGKMMFPLVFCILPSLFVVVLGPAMYQFYQAFFGKK